MQPLQRDVDAAPEKQPLELAAHQLGRERAGRLGLGARGGGHLGIGELLLVGAAPRFLQHPGRIFGGDDGVHASVIARKLGAPAPSGQMFFATGAGSHGWHPGCCTRGMLRGCVTDLDFDLIEEVFPGIVRYYRELKEKPLTFLELWWDFTHAAAGCVAVTNPPVSPATRGATGRSS